MCRMEVEQKNSLNNDIKVLKEYLIKENKQHLLVWLQKTLLEVCYVKLILTNSELRCERKDVLQPVAYYYARKYKKKQH